MGILYNLIKKRETLAKQYAELAKKQAIIERKKQGVYHRLCEVEKSLKTEKELFYKHKKFFKKGGVNYD